MTFEELDRQYPNGFVDAELISFSVDYQNRIATLKLNLRRNPPDSESCREYNRGVLALEGLYYLVIEPPDVDHLRYPPRALQVDGYSEDPLQFILLEELKKTLTGHEFCCRLYVHDWNSFIHIAARNARLSWVEDVVPA